MKTVPKSIWDVDMDDDLEYLGMIDDNTYFVIFCPERFGDWDNFVVGIGPEEDIKQVEVTGGMRYQTGTTVINIYIAERKEFGTFFFPHHNNKGKEPTFNGQPIDLF